MEFEERRILELFLGLVFVAILAMIVVLVFYLPDSGRSVPSTSNVISNSYNTYNVVEVPQKEIYVVKNYYDKNIFLEKNYEREYLDYSSYGEHEREETIFNNYRDEFRVYVVNKDYDGGYFKVKFYFCDYYDNCFSETIEKYIPAGEEEKFYYVDVHDGKYKYDEWGYKVFPDRVD